MTLCLKFELKRVLEKIKYPVYNLLRSNQKILCHLMIALRITIVIYSYQLSSIAVVLSELWVDTVK